MADEKPCALTELLTTLSERGTVDRATKDRILAEYTFMRNATPKPQCACLVWEAAAKSEPVVSVKLGA